MWHGRLSWCEPEGRVWCMHGFWGKEGETEK
jgi:hypothetical protein